MHTHTHAPTRAPPRTHPPPHTHLKLCEALVFESTRQSVAEHFLSTFRSFICFHDNILTRHLNCSFIEPYSSSAVCPSLCVSDRKTCQHYKEAMTLPCLCFCAVQVKIFFFVRSNILWHCDFFVNTVCSQLKFNFRL